MSPLHPLSRRHRGKRMKGHLSKNSGQYPGFFTAEDKWHSVSRGRRRGQAAGPPPRKSPTPATRRPGDTHPSAAPASRAAPCGGRGGVAGGRQRARTDRAASWRSRACAQCAPGFSAYTASGGGPPAGGAVVPGVRGRRCLPRTWEERRFPSRHPPGEARQ